MNQPPPPPPPLPSLPCLPADDDALLLREIAAGDAGAFDRFVARHQRRLYRYLYHRVGDAHRAEDLLQEVFLRIFRATATSGRDAGEGQGAVAGGGAGGGADASNAISVDAINVRNLGAWMFTIAQRCAADYFRSCRRRPLALQSDLGDASSMSDLLDRGGALGGGGSGGGRWGAGGLSGGGSGGGGSGAGGGDPLAGAISAESDRRVLALLAELPAEQREIVSLRIFADVSFPEIAEITQVPLSTVKSRMRYALEKLAQRVDANLHPKTKVLS